MYIKVWFKFKILGKTPEEARPEIKNWEVGDIIKYNERRHYNDVGEYVGINKNNQFILRNYNTDIFTLLNIYDYCYNETYIKHKKRIEANKLFKEQQKKIISTFPDELKKQIIRRSP